VATHSAPGQPFGRPVIQPTEVIRRREPRQLDDFSQLFRQELEAGPSEPDTPQDLQDLQDLQDKTQELDPVSEPDRPRAAQPVTSSGRWSDGLPTARAVVVLSSGVAAGFLAALLAVVTLGNGDAPPSSRTDSPPRAAAPAPSAPAGTTPPAPPAASPPNGATDPDGAGVLRQGSSGPDVIELQKRLLHIPDVYQGGQVNGTYDATLTAAVARFQLWYGIRGDETGVYGDDTRHDLESRT
jgi:hypothetical protein